MHKITWNGREIRSGKDFGTGLFYAFLPKGTERTEFSDISEIQAIMDLVEALIRKQKSLDIPNGM